MKIIRHAKSAYVTSYDREPVQQKCNSPLYFSPNEQTKGFKGNNILNTSAL